MTTRHLPAPPGRAAPAPVESAAGFLGTVLDGNSFLSWDSPPQQHLAADNPGYRRDLDAACERAGTDEAVVTGQGTVHGHPVAVICSEFGFLGGSIGTASARRLIQAVERATEQRLPLIAASASGGTRMQEGTAAFLCMPAISGAIARHKAAGLPYLVYLRHPTTGGVLASWASLGHLTFAEPAALVGFLGPKVYRALRGKPFPPGVQTAGNLLRQGVIDAVVPPAQLAEVLADVLSVCTARPPRHTVSESQHELPYQAVPSAWEAVTATRRTGRPGARDLLVGYASHRVHLSGTGRGEPAHGIQLALACFGPYPCVLIAQDRAAQASQPIGPGSLRAARRAIQVAAGLHLPIVTIIDTDGAELSPDAEEGALAGEIASCIADLFETPVPTLAVLLGQGSGGGALALLPADRVLAAANAWLAPLPPEGASAIVYGTPDHARQTVTDQGIRSADLLALGIVDAIVPEDGHAGNILPRVAAAIEGELGRLSASPAQGQDERLARRRSKYRQVAG